MAKHWANKTITVCLVECEITSTVANENFIAVDRGTVRVWLDPRDAHENIVDYSRGRQGLFRYFSSDYFKWIREITPSMSVVSADFEQVMNTSADVGHL